MRRLLNLLKNNAKRGEFRAEGNSIYVYDAIVSSDAEAEWFGGVSAEGFCKALAGMSGPVNIRLNCPGGDVFAGRAMAQAMRDYKDPIIAHVDGFAASAASLLAVSADKCVMAPGSFLMIHKAWTLEMGNADDMLATAALLEKIDATLAQTYAAKTGGNVDDYAAMMAKETWFTPEEAVTAKLADEITANVAKGAQAVSQWDLSAYTAPPAQNDTLTVTLTVTVDDEDDGQTDAAEASAAASNEQRARIHAVRLLQTI